MVWENPQPRQPSWCQQAMEVLNRQLLKVQNRLFFGTLGVSQNNRHLGFLPAYWDTRTATACLSRFANGEPAPIHILDGLPGDWVQERDANGRVMCARPGVIAGFIRDDRFYTREEAAKAL
jgi:hypothetical protein